MERVINNHADALKDLCNVIRELNASLARVVQYLANRPVTPPPASSFNEVFSEAFAKAKPQSKPFPKRRPPKLKPMKKPDGEPPDNNWHASF
jgi:hypothetical protein